MTADHRRAPVLEPLVGYRREGRLSFTPPGHKQARGVDPAVREVLGDAVFHGDVLARPGSTTASPGAACCSAPRS